MDITFLIGNGFDLAIGLRTSYVQFLEYYVKIASNNCSHLSKFKAEIEKNITDWSDAEKALGEYSAEFSNTENDSYCSCCDDILLELAKYLGKEESRLDLGNSSNMISENIKKALKDFTIYLLPESRRVLTGILNKNQYQEKVFNFINFNYTNTLDKCLNNLNPILIQQNHNNIIVSDKIGKVIHVHGKIGNYMIMGVNDKSQIKNLDFRKNKLVRQTIVKPEVNARLHLDNIEECSQIIQNSMFICIFGMSLGETDTMWWEKLSIWLSENKEHHLIIFNYNNGHRPLLPRSYFEIEDRLREFFFDHSAVANEQIDDFLSRIHVCINSNIFSDPNPLPLIE